MCVCVWMCVGGQSRVLTLVFPDGLSPLGSPPALGIAFFAYLLLVDHMEQSYLPMVIRFAPLPATT